MPTGWMRPTCRTRAELMESQHRSMLERLRAGAFDPHIREQLGPGARGRRHGPARPTATAVSDEPGCAARPRPSAAPRECARSPAASFGRRRLHPAPGRVILDYLVENAQASAKASFRSVAARSRRAPERGLVRLYHVSKAYGPAAGHCAT
jgi:hypothetical protein